MFLLFVYIYENILLGYARVCVNTYIYIYIYIYIYTYVHVHMSIYTHECLPFNSVEISYLETQ